MQPEPTIVWDGEPGDPMGHPAFRAVAHVHDRAGARATGSWRFADGRLLLEAFMAWPEMRPEVVEGFPLATADVPVTDTGLGIVRAARTKEVTEYRAEDLPAESGSGYWLRAFPADRSIAVPQLDASGDLVRILSVAVAGLDEPVTTYESIVRDVYSRYLSL